MTASIDLNLLPVSRYAGRDYPELLGLHYSEPPHRPARGRDADRLVFYLIFEGNAPPPAEKRDQLLSDLAKLYYHTPGSVTAALRKVSEEINRILLERNLGLGASRQSIGHLVQVVIRDGRITIAQSGALHAFLISDQGINHYYAPELAGRGLGLAKSSEVSFSQAEVKPNDTILLTAKPSVEWTSDVLKSIYGQGPEGLRRRLFNPGISEINALAMQVKQGKGKHYLLWMTGGQTQPPPVPMQKAFGTAPGIEVPPPESQEEAQPIPELKIPAPVSTPTDIQKSMQPAESEMAAGIVVAGTINASPNAEDANLGQIPIAADVPKTFPGQQAPTPAGRSTAISLAVGGFFAQIGIALKKFGIGLLASLKIFIGRLLPDEVLLQIPSGIMALIAVAVPVAIVTAASITYFRLGRAAQFELLSTQARQAAMQAMEISDLGQKRSNLGTALSLLQRAEEFAASPESQAEINALETQVRDALDGLDYVRRVDYQSAIIGGLPLSANIIDMASFEDELYLLDKNGGGVFRAVLTDQGYEVDYTFQCGPGVYSEITVSPFIDIIAWPAGYEPEAKILAADSSGHVLYCRPDLAPQAERLTPAEAESWGDVLQATLDQGDFYALDLPSNGVWIFWRANFTEQPELFFDENIPPLNEVIDMLVDRDDLYLLQSDGKLMVCVRNTLVVAPTRCSFQAYIDRRPGKENLPLEPPAPFTQILSTQPPDPSLYLLEPKNQAIYHFSLRNLTFQKQYLPEDPLPSKPATSFAINQDRRFLFLALGNQIYYAAMP